MTLNELFDIYIEDVDMINQVTTTDSIKYRYKSHLKPVFGNIELEAIYPDSTIICDPLSLSVSCHIGPHALAIAACKKII